MSQTYSDSTALILPPFPAIPNIRTRRQPHQYGRDRSHECAKPEADGKPARSHRPDRPSKPHSGSNNTDERRIEAPDFKTIKQIRQRQPD